MKKKMKLIKSSFKVILANGIYSFSQLILISIMTKVYDLETVGIYSSAMALILPIITFLGLNLRAIQLTDIDNKYKIPDFIVLRVLGAILTVIFVLSFSLLKGGSSFAFLITLLLLIRKVSELFSETAHSKLIKDNRYKEYTFSLMFLGGISVFVFVSISYLFKDFILSLTLYSLVWLLILIFYDFKNINIIEEFKGYKFNKKVILNLIIVAFPLAVVSTINVLYNNIPRYFVEYYISIEALGVFSAISYVSLVGGIFLTGITLIFSTKLSEIDKSEDYKKFMEIVLSQILLVTIICIIMFIFFYYFGDVVLPLIYTNEFVAYLNIILWLIVAMTLSFIAKILGTACTSMHKNKEQLIIACVSIGALLISCYLLIPSYNLAGAAFSMIIAYGLKNVLLITVIGRKIITHK